jgi:serine/threonine protein kinase
MLPENDQMQIGAYRLISRLGAGGMGEVYLAEDTRLHRRVALKLLPHGTEDDISGARSTHRHLQLRDRALRARRGRASILRRAVTAKSSRQSSRRIRRRSPCLECRRLPKPMSHSADPSLYVFRKYAELTNLFRIPLH